MPSASLADGTLQGPRYMAQTWHRRGASLPPDVFRFTPCLDWCLFDRLWRPGGNVGARNPEYALASPGQIGAGQLSVRHCSAHGICWDWVICVDDTQCSIAQRCVAVCMTCCREWAPAGCRWSCHGLHLRVCSWGRAFVGLFGVHCSKPGS